MTSSRASTGSVPSPGASGFVGRSRLATETAGTAPESSAVKAAGLFAFPFVWVLGLAWLYADYASHPLVRAVITGVGAAGAGLFIGTAVKLGRPLVRKPVAVMLVAGCFVAVGIGRLSLLVVLPCALALALLAAWRRAL